MLESMRMVAPPRRRVGITIQPSSAWNVFDPPRVIRWRLDVGDRAAQLMSLSELRRGFEPAAAALAARRATLISAGSWPPPYPTWWYMAAPAT